jgi:hypothetical protein
MSVPHVVIPLVHVCPTPLAEMRLGTGDDTAPLKR